MMGLLGDITDDPATMGLLSLGFGLMGARGNIGQGLGQAGPMAPASQRGGLPALAGTNGWSSMVFIVLHAKWLSSART